MDPAFRIHLLAPETAIEPGGYYKFAIDFEPPDAGSFQGTLLIETDGFNTTCPNPSQLVVSVRGQL